MASKYDSIKTAKDLLIEVRQHGLSLAQEDIVRAQDIFGHSSVRELNELANDTGIDSEGWSTGKKGFQSEFYAVAFSIWHWEDAVRFYIQNTDPTHKQLEEARKENQGLAEMVKHHEAEITKEHKLRIEAVRDMHDAEDKCEKLEAELHDRDMTIMELKARLYDLMVKEAK